MRDLGEGCLLLLIDGHGGREFEHDGLTVQERTTFLTASKDAAV